MEKVKNVPLQCSNGNRMTGESERHRLQSETRSPAGAVIANRPLVHE